LPVSAESFALIILIFFRTFIPDNSLKICDIRGICGFNSGIRLRRSYPGRREGENGF